MKDLMKEYGKGYLEFLWRGTLVCWGLGVLSFGLVWLFFFVKNLREELGRK